ncbi:MAG: hypothetical protein P4M00_05170 [Azospirillaceae bacterium]|nr:hypothetical protein [Azospirillaceae bacterium]
MMLRIAQVVAVHPDRRTLDLVFTDDGWHAAEVPVSSGMAHSDGGIWAVPSVKAPVSEGASGGLAAAGARSLLAVCGFIDHTRPLVLGFVSPQGSQMSFAEQDRAIYRHATGAYATIAPDGSIEANHPGGAYLRIGSGAHQDLAPLAADGNWQIAAAPAPQITVVTAGFTLVIQPGGNTTLTSGGTLTAQIQGSVAVATPADLALTSGGNMTLAAGGGLSLSGGQGTTVHSSGAMTIECDQPFAVKAPTIDLN